MASTFQPWQSCNKNHYYIHIARKGTKNECFTKQCASNWANSLPPAYVVRREGNSFTLFVCPHRGGGGGGGQVQPTGGGGVRSSCGGGVRRHFAPSCGWYASCVHAGGLSCAFNLFLNVKMGANTAVQKKKRFYFEPNNCLKCFWQWYPLVLSPQALDYAPINCHQAVHCLCVRRSYQNF